MLHNNIKKKQFSLIKKKFQNSEKNSVKCTKGGDKTQICIQRKKKKILKKPPTTTISRGKIPSTTTITNNNKSTSRDVQRRVSPKCLRGANVHQSR